MSNLNDIKWEEIFDKYNVLQCIEKEGFFDISATQIREYREPRLMVKFDHENNLPKIFRDNKLSILPITRGDYKISHFKAYHKLEVDNTPIVRASLPYYIQSLDSSNISSESIALNCAFASGIIADFLKDDYLVPTVSGRMGSGKFIFSIKNTSTNKYQKVEVKKSQIEIDAAYEGIESFAIFEAKMDLAEDFLIRQLYYPFRVWKNRVDKVVKPIFLMYSNGVYRLYEYMFEDPNNYNSLCLVNQMSYSIEDLTISLYDIYEVLNNVKILDEPEIPFPQADKFERVINICELLGNQELSRVDITQKYDFDVRQTNYYADAARYLGLIEKRKENGNIIYFLSKLGKKIIYSKFKERQLEYCKCILSHKVFNDSLRKYLSRGEMLKTEEIVKIMKNCALYNVNSDNTFKRRSSTVKNWLDWIVSLINDLD